MPVIDRAPKLARRLGFTMIEVLVTLVILMIGLLGIAGLMAQGQRASFEAYQRQQALALASDMAERIKANRPGVDSTAVAATYSDAGALIGSGTLFTQLTTGGIANCATEDCSTADIVRYDLALWDGLLRGAATETDTATGASIGPLLTARGCVQTLPGATACPAPGGPPASRQVTYRVSVAWQGNYPTAAPTTIDAANTCGQGVYASEDTRRMVSVDVYTVLACP